MFKKMKFKVLMFAAAVFLGAGNLYAWNVNIYSDLTDAITASTTTITFTAANINFAGNPAISYAGPVNIYGNGATLNGINTYRFFTFTNTNVRFYDNINFINGYSGSNGGAILNEANSTMTFTGSVVNFSSNTAGGGGGAIYNNNRSTIAFTNSTITFSSNTAVGEGGAISNYDSSIMTFANSNITFSSNTAGGSISSGGAIENVIDSIMTFTGSTVTFSGNTAKTSGSAIRQQESTMTFTNSNVTFSDNWGTEAIENGVDSIMTFTGSTVMFSSNTAGDYGGGAIYNNNRSTIAFTNSNITFDGNKAARAGAVYNSFRSIMTFSGSTVTFSGNTASSLSLWGGAIGNSNNSTMTFTGSSVTFDGNVAVSSGGAVSNMNNSIMDFVSSTVSFINNTARYGGGAIYNSGSAVNFTDSIVKFDNNTTVTTTTTASLGGVIYNDNNGNIAFANSTVTFSGNRTDWWGGAIRNNNNSTMTFTNGKVSFIGNTARAYGGAIHNNDAEMIFTNGNITFSSNTAGTSGGAIYNDFNSTITFINSDITFSINKASSSAGAIGNNNNSVMTFTGSTIIFSSNTAVLPGGAIYNYSSTMTFTNSSITFINNKTGTSIVGSGGAISNSRIASVMTFTGSTVTFSSNTANQGGAISNDTSKITFTNSNIIFSSNTANTTGGAINSYNAATVFTGSTVTFSGNKANTFGGAIHNNLPSTITFTNGNITFDGNIAVSSGGAISNTSNSLTDFAYSTASFINNTAGYAGGAIFSTGSAVNFTGSIVKFENNKTTATAAATGRGGAIYNDNSGNITFANSTVTFSSNTVNSRGGAIYNTSNSTITFTNSNVTFSSNTGSTASGGGAIAMDSLSNISFIGGKVTFSSNTAYEGGAVYNVGNSTMLFTNGNITFSSNTANRGGAISNTNSMMTFTGSTVTFSSNTASFIGGAIYSYTRSTMAFTNSAITFDGNIAASSGGAVFNTGNSLADFAYSTVSFMNNTAAYSGGAILSTGSAVNFTGSIVKFENNKTTATSNPSYSGGAIYNNNSAMTFAASTVTFSTNTTNGLGGAIYNIGNSVMTFSTSSVTFSSNMALNNYGGAVYNANSLIAFTNGNITFSINGANYGGAIHNDNSTMAFTNGKASFIGNTARNAGGGIYNQSSTMTFANAGIIFSSNTAALSGGAIYSTGNSIMTFSASTVTFSSNTAAGSYGGAIYSNNSAITFSTSAVNFSSNTAAMYGGAICNELNSRMTFTGSTVMFSSNTAGQGGAIINFSNSTMTFTDSAVTFSSNTASTLGGAIYNMGVINFNTVAGSSVIFSGNLANGQRNDIYQTVATAIINITGGGYMYMDGGVSGAATAGTIQKDSSGLFLNEGNNSGFKGYFNQTAGTTTITALGTMFGGTNTISTSLLEVYGADVYYGVNLATGGVLNHYDTSLTISTVGANNNIQFTASGATAMFGLDALLQAPDVYAYYNLAGVIDNGQSNTVAFDNSYVTFAITDYTGASTYTFTNSVIDISNQVSNSTRAITFTDVIADNSALNFGLLFSQISASSFSLATDELHTSAQSTGILDIFGNIKIYDGDQYTTLTDTYDYESQVLFGGLRFDSALTTSSVTVGGSELEHRYEIWVKNDSLFQTIYVRALGGWTLYDANLQDGDREYFIDGAGVYHIDKIFTDTSWGRFLVEGGDSDASKWVISGVIESTDTYNGLNSYLFTLSTATEFTLKDVTVTSASRTGSGSVIEQTYWNSTATITNVNFAYNTATSSGGAISTIAGVMDIVNANFTGNEAEYGGAIYSGNSGLRITDSEFSGNIAASSGGAIYNAGTINLEATNGSSITFRGNRASGTGDDIYNEGTINITGLGDVVISSGIAGAGIIEKTAGNLYLGGDNSVFTGSFTQNAGNTLVTGNYFAGISSITAGILELASGASLSTGTIGVYNGALLDITTGGDLSFSGNITGNGSITKEATATGLFELSGDNSGFTGIFTQYAGTTSVSGNYFTGISSITGGSVNMMAGAGVNAAMIGVYGGSVNFATSAVVGILDAGAGEIGVMVDWFDGGQGNDTSFIYTSTTNITADSRLAVTTVTAPMQIVGSSTSIMSAEWINGVVFSTGNIYGGDKYGYRFIWSGAAGDWTGWLVYGALPWNTFVGQYQEAAVGSTITLGQDIIAIAGDENPFLSPAGNNFTIDGAGYVINSSGLANKGMTLSGKNITMQDVTFINFSTAASGGVMYANSGSSIAFYGENSFINNAANLTTGSGGAIYNANNSEMAFSGSTVSFSSNAAGGGGAIYNISSALITFINGNITFSSNTSSSGGAVYNTAGSTMAFTYSSITFSSNTADIAGGAIRNNIAEMTFTNSNITFSNSRSSLYGGAIYNDNNSTMTFAGSTVTFSINTAGISGGAIYNTNNSTMTFTNGSITFDGNIAASSGGAVYNDNNSVIDFASTLLSFINNSANFGGAVYAGNNSNTNFGGGEVNFEGNEAGSLGGALYISGSTVSFNTDGGEVLFTGNKANGKANDVYMDMDAILNISGSNTIRFEGGIITSSINVSGIEINKSGPGAIYLGGDSEVWGDFNIIGGDIVMLESATYRGKALELPTGSALDMENGTVNTIEVDGNFATLTNVKMDVFYDGTNDVIKADTADIGGNIDIFAGVGTYNNKEFHLIITSTAPNLNGVFTSSSISKADHGYFTYELKYEDGIVKLIIDGISRTNFGGLSPLTYNQSETARAFDNLSANPGLWQQILNEMTVKQNSGTDSEIAEIKEFLAETSGYFLSNVIRNMAADSPNNEVYDKIRNHREEHRTNSGLWVQLKGGIEKFKEDENSIEDYKDTSMGVMFGFDRFLADKYAGADVMWGVYGRINKDNIEQGSGHSADGNKNGLGVYGGYLRDSWELKGMLLGSYDRFSTERMTFGGDKAKADINAFTLSADVEAALVVVLTNTIYFKPYLGIEAQNTMYEGFKETGAGMYNLDVRSGNYLRSAGRLGLGLDYEKGRWIWYANVEGKYMIAGTNHEIKSEFEQTGVEFYSRSSEEGEIQIGAGLGGEVRIGQNWKAFINGKYYMADRYENLYGNVGVRYMFGKKRNGAAKEAVREAKLSAEEAERLAEEALAKSKEALVKVEEAKDLKEEMNKAEDKAAKEEIYELKIKTAKEAIERAEEGINKADEAIKKGEEVQNKVDAARINKARATEEGYGITKAEKAELDSIEMSAERALNKAEEAKANAMRAKAEAKILLLALEAERTRNEELERQRQEAMIKKEISDADLAKQKAEAQERRKRPMLQTYTLTANFKTGSYMLSEEFKAQIREIAQGLARYDYKHITIEGHTDNTGSLEVNKRLSRQRARSVHDEFIKAGIPAEKISYAGFADSMPVKSNSTAAGRAANRRTEIFIE